MPTTSTNDKVLLILTWSMAIVIVISGAVILLLVVFRPDADVKEAANNIGDIINTVVGALLGYMAGSYHASSQDESEVVSPK